MQENYIFEPVSFTFGSLIIYTIYMPSFCLPVDMLANKEHDYHESSHVFSLVNTHHSLVVMYCLLLSRCI